MYMPMKKGAGGRQQSYDARGRYVSNQVMITPTDAKISKKEKAVKAEVIRRTNLMNRARKSKDAFLFDAYLAIESEFPGEVVAVNDMRFDENIGREREFDIITKKCIIEVKSKQVRRKLTQLQQQKLYAESKNKKHIVFAPEILPACKREYEQNGIVITTSKYELLQAMKGVKK